MAPHSHLAPFLGIPFEQRPLSGSDSLCQATEDYLERSVSQLHRYPEEEYAEFLRALARRSGRTEQEIFLCRTAAEALEYLVEVLVGESDNVLVYENHPLRPVLSRQVELRSGVIQCASTVNASLLDQCQPKLMVFYKDIPEAVLVRLANAGFNGFVVVVNPALIYASPAVVHLFELPISLNPLPPVMGFCPNTPFLQSLRKAVAPFHLPTHLLDIGLKRVESFAFPKETRVLEPDVVPDLERVVQPAIHAIQPYVPGKGVKVMARELGMPASAFTKLASNEHPFGMRPEVVSALKAILDEWRGTPPTYEEAVLRLKVGILSSVFPDASEAPMTPGQIQFGSGSVDLIKAAVKAFVPAGGKVLSPKFPFAMYPFETAKRPAGYHFVPLADHYQLSVEELVRGIREERPHLVFLANPRNPLGTAISDVSPIIDALTPEQTLILDEAYIDFIRAEMGPDVYPDGAALILAHPDKRIISLRTFSKSYAIASFRLGYSLARPGVSEALGAVNLPCNVDPVSLAAGIASLETPGASEWIAETARFVIGEKQRIYDLLTELNLVYVRSYSNFIFFETGDQFTGKALFDALVAKGVIIRPVMERAVRMNVGSASENDAFIRAMREVYAS